MTSSSVAAGEAIQSKTYTIVGDPADEERKGLLTCSLDTIFTSIATAKAADPLLSFATTVSFVSVYNEEINDLLSEERCKLLTIRETPAEGVHIRDLTAVSVESTQEALQ